MKTWLIAACFALLFVSTTLAAWDEPASISVSLVNQDPDPAIAGGIAELRIGIENQGSQAANSLSLELVPSYPFSLVSGDQAVKDIGTMNAYQTGLNQKIVKYRLNVDENAPKGTYDVTFKCSGTGLLGVVTRTVSIDVDNRESLQVSGIDKTTLIPGQETELTFTVVNVGSSPLNNIVFSWENADDVVLPVGSDNTRYINGLGIGESAEITYGVIADTGAAPGLYKLDISIIYDNPISGESREVSTVAGMYVGGMTDFDVSFSESSGSDVSFSVANVGSNPAYSVSVSVPQQAGWAVSGPSASIIGNLNNGDYTVATFSLSRSMQRNATTAPAPRGNRTFVAQAAMPAVQGSILIKIDYTDTMGRRRSVEKTVQMAAGVSQNNTAFPSAFRGRPSGQADYTLYVAALAVLAAAAFLAHRKGMLGRILKREGKGKR